MIINRFYPYLLSGLILILMVLSFLIGREDGRAQKNDSSVILSCTPEVLSTLQIPPQNRLTGQESQDIPSLPAVLSESTKAPGGKFLGSKNGTKYYTPDCAGTKRIKPENYVWFSDEEDAKIQGYTPAKC